MNCPEPETLSDYVLALLPVGRQQEIATHLAICESCRDWVSTERAMARQIRDVIMATPIPSQRQMRALMPSLPRPRLPVPFMFLRPVAALGVLLALFLGSLQLQQSAAGQSPHGELPTALAATATQLPEAGLTATVIQETSSLTLAPVPVAALQPAVTPAPSPHTP
jgi:hypothetical protein